MGYIMKDEGRKKIKIDKWGIPGHPKSYFFGELKPHTKFQNPMIIPSGRKVTQAEEEEMTLNSVTAHASRSDQLYGLHDLHGLFCGLFGLDDLYSLHEPISISS